MHTTNIFKYIISASFPVKWSASPSANPCSMRPWLIYYTKSLHPHLPPIIPNNFDRIPLCGFLTWPQYWRSSICRKDVRIYSIHADSTKVIAICQDCAWRLVYGILGKIDMFVSSIELPSVSKRKYEVISRIDRYIGKEVDGKQFWVRGRLRWRKFGCIYWTGS